MISSDTFMRVSSAQGDYTVEQYENLDNLFDSLASISNGFVIADENVVELYPRAFTRLDAMPIHCMPANESEKTLVGVERALLALQASGGSKRTTVIAIGGGIVQDVATLVAHLWYRGIDFVYVPTTLLSMADSCIGAKSAVNLGAFKNQIGTFKSPKRVLTCEQFIATLSDEAVSSGYGEIVKLAIVESAAAFTRIRADVERDGMRGPNLSKHIQMSLETKRKIIEIDEYEQNVRKTLNFGHTFGHALESTVDNEVPHGLSVAWGIDVAGYIAWRKGMLDRSVYERVHGFLSQTFHCALNRPYTADSLIAAMRRDKKAAAGEVALILPRTLGNLEIVPTVIDDALEALIADYLSNENFFTGH